MDEIDNLRERVAYLEDRDIYWQELMMNLSEEFGSQLFVRREFHERKKILHQILYRAYRIDEAALYSVRIARSRGLTPYINGNVRLPDNDGKAARYVCWFILNHWENYATYQVLEQEYGFADVKNTTPTMQVYLSEDSQRNRVAAIEREFMIQTNRISSDHDFHPTNIFDVNTSSRRHVNA